MWDWIGENAEKIGAGVLAIGGVFAVVWGKLQSMRTEKAKTGADVAIAESQREVFEQMKERLTSLDTALHRCQVEIDELRMEVRDRDSKIHALELYVKDLQHELQKHGIDVPPMR
jgi:archaellum component FlaC